MAAVTAAKAAKIAASVLFRKNEDGQSNLQKLLIGIAVAFAALLILLYAVVQIFLWPVSQLAEFFLPDSITEAKSTLTEDFVLPVCETPKVSLVSFPVEDDTISSGYGERTIEGRPDLSFHEGLDFPVPFDTKVMAIAPGMVADTGIDSNYGSYILIKHTLYRYDQDGELLEEETFYSLYAHLYRVYVFEGQEIEERQQIATSGGDPARHFAGNTTGAHLHLELRHTEEQGSHFDPYDYILNPEPFEGQTKSIEWG